MGQGCGLFEEAPKWVPRIKVWQQQPESFFDLAIIEEDGTLVETRVERKDGIGMNYQKQWGNHPLLITREHFHVFRAGDCGLYCP